MFEKPKIIFRKICVLYLRLFPVIKIVGIFSFLLLLGFQLQAQSVASERVRYERGFSFNPGIYLTHADFRNNNPVPSSRIQSMSYQAEDVDFFSMILTNIFIHYTDSADTLRKVRSNAIWGYSDGRSIFMLPKVRVAIIGAICHLTIFVNNENATFFDSYGGLVGLVQVQQESIYQFIVDHETGELMLFNKNNLESIIARDEELFAAYKVAKGKKKERLYKFMNLYNEKHPIYFPN